MPTTDCLDCPELAPAGTTTLVDAIPTAPAPPAAPTAPTARDRPAARCRRCGEPVTLAWATVVSSHATSAGVVSYLRCPCGGLAIHERRTTSRLV